MTDFFNEIVTIYNDVPADGVNPRSFNRFVIEKCNVQKGILQTADGTIEKVANAITVTSKSVAEYLSPTEYARLPKDLKTSHYTANVNDFVVFGEVEDIVADDDAQGWQTLKKKYKDNGFSVTASNAYIFGLTVDNVQIIHA